ncbi:MAG: DUF4372 domain-containing protein, partial [Nitrospirota bacterium]
MYIGKTVFAQLMEFVPWTSLTRIVARHGGDKEGALKNQVQHVWENMLHGNYLPGTSINRYLKPEKSCLKNG